MIKEKKEVSEGQPPQWTKKSNLPEVTKSWHDYQVTNHSPLPISFDQSEPSFHIRSARWSGTSSRKFSRCTTVPIKRK